MIIDRGIVESPDDICKGKWGHMVLVLPTSRKHLIPIVINRRETLATDPDTIYFRPFDPNIQRRLNPKPNSH
jgi:hypothetical protein